MGKRAQKLEPELEFKRLYAHPTTLSNYLNDPYHKKESTMTHHFRLDLVLFIQLILLILLISRQSVALPEFKAQLCR